MNKLEIYTAWYLLKIPTQKIVEEKEKDFEEFLKNHGVLIEKPIYTFIKKQEKLLKETFSKIITIFDEDYPALLKNSTNPPAVLFCLGNCGLLNSRLFTIVGTRKATSYGKSVTKKFAIELSEHFAIVSGMAFGIDKEVHEATLEANGKTIAVLASGVDVPTPKSNESTYRKILKKDGAIISPYPLSSKPKKHQFVERNYILAAMSAGTLVTEAPEKSGALITAKIAAEEGRDVFSIPGDITRYTSRGTNNLIKDGAIPATSPEDIIEYYSLSKKKTGSEEEINDPVLQAVLSGYETAEEISQILNLPVNQVLSKITELELLGLIENDNGRIKPLL
ncbi:MAG: DNA-processing protein DprA [Thermotogaceae bacterium]|nr:DNA-processing protein DprA [Thermotogaceae bacterium]